MASLFGMEKREVIRIKVKVRNRQQYETKTKVQADFTKHDRLVSVRSRLYRLDLDLLLLGL